MHRPGPRVVLEVEAVEAWAPALSRCKVHKRLHTSGREKLPAEWAGEDGVLAVLHIGRRRNPEPLNPKP